MELPEGAFYDVPADWVDWADTDDAEAAPWTPEEIADADAKASLIAAGPREDCPYCAPDEACALHTPG